MTRRDYAILGLIALVVGIGLLLTVNEPGYTDAYYYFNAAERLADGEGLTDPYIWLYLNAPDEIPMPSHTYWMPLTSLLSGISMTIFGGSFTAAQLPFLPLLVMLVLFTAWLGYALGGKPRYGWQAGLLVLAGGYYLPFWMTTDGFVLFGLVGAGAIACAGCGIQTGDWRYFAAAGALSALGHLTRADGPLLAAVALMVLWWPWQLENRHPDLNRRLSAGALIAAYFVVMMPWFVRNMVVIGSPLPSGGINTMFLRGYNELFAYPVDWSLSNFLDWGLGNILDSRLQAGTVNLATWVAVEGLVIVGPLALWALWKQRRHPMLTTFWLYAVLLHIAMTVFFAYPGYRGGLLHSSAALFPFWMVLGVMGLDMGIEKMAAWRNWNAPQAKNVFGAALVVMAVFIGVAFSRLQAAAQEGGNTYTHVADEYLPDDAVLMVNSPPTWYYYTDLHGVALPDAELERLPEIAERYCVTHLVLDVNVTDSFVPLFEGTAELQAFLTEIAHLDRGTDDIEDDIRVYRFNIQC